MTFPANEREALLLLKGVGPTVIQRLEEIGIHSLRDLSRFETAEITRLVAQMLHTTCWSNSPQARGAIDAAVALARQTAGTPPRE